MPKSFLCGCSARNPRFFKCGLQGGDLGLEPYKNRNVARREGSGKAVQVVGVLPVHKCVGRCAKQMLYASGHPAGLGMFVGRGKEAQISRKLLRCLQRAALPLVQQKAAGHVEHVLA